MIKISFVGDINPGGVLTFMGGVSSEVINILAQADLRVGTLESAIGNTRDFSFSEKKMIDKSAHIIYSPDNSLGLLNRLNINVVSLANNHIGDLGVDGIRNTINKLKECQIAYFGAGENINEASKPYVTTIHGKTICIFGFVKMGYKHLDIATANTPGVYAYNEDEIKNAISRYKQLYDYVFVCPHWGKEHSYFPQMKVIETSKNLIDMGADGVISSHTHVVQPVFRYKSKFVATSLGNFLFPDRYIDNPRVTVYPTEEQRTGSIPVTYEYPIVDQLTLKKIPSKSRIGCIINYSFNENYGKIDQLLCWLDEDNKLGLFNANARHKFLLFGISLLMRCKPLYKLILKIKR